MSTGRACHGPVTLALQTAYRDTVLGRSERWSQWLDYAAPTRAGA